MTKEPKTTVRSYRLSDETLRNLNESAAAMRASATETVRRLSAAMATFARDYALDGDVPLEAYAAAEVGLSSASPEPTGSLACPLGYGHTAHVWELIGTSMEGVYHCGGQPFRRSGFDPIDEPTAPIKEAVDAAAPHIVRLARERAMRDVVTRMEGYGDRIDPTIVQHFRSLSGPED